MIRRLAESIDNHVKRKEAAMATELKIVVEAGEGESVWLGGVGVDFKIPDEMTGGAFAIVEHPLDPGRLIPPHIHYREDELSYVLSGEIGVRIGDRDYVWRGLGATSSSRATSRTRSGTQVPSRRG